MKYYEVNFTLCPVSEDACDILSALLADCGFETFEYVSNGVTAYVQQSSWNEDAVKECIGQFPFPISITYRKKDAPDEDWNRVWEEEGFEPIVLGDRICVHDNKHCPSQTYPYDILINPKLAFGTGTHPTTQMILGKLLECDLTGKKVIDAGCGTGVLGILAKQKGAKNVFAYDIDEWSVVNATENFQLNGYSDETIRLGDSSLLVAERDYDLLIANINRNILLADLSRFAATLRKGGEILLSGFYLQDVELLKNEAEKLGLCVKDKKSINDWCLLCLG